LGSSKIYIMAVRKPSFMGSNSKKHDDKLPAAKGKGKVILDMNIYKTIIASMTRYSNPRIQEADWIEAMGLLYGYNDGENVVVTEAVPFTHVKKAGHILKVQFSDEDYALAADIESNFYLRDPPQFIVGWFHSHPGILVMLSQDDVKNQLAWQTNNPLAIALVFNHNRLLKQIEVAPRKGDPVKRLENDPGFKIFRLDNANKGMQASYADLNYEFSDFPMDANFINNAQQFGTWVGKAFPRDDAVHTEYKKYIDNTIQKLDEIFNGTRSYIKTLIRKMESARIPEIIENQSQEAKKILESGQTMVAMFRMMIPYLEYKERARLLPLINEVLATWDQKINGFMEAFFNLANTTLDP
jgi:proteasome lid subunit RPN8/RPN11